MDSQSVGRLVERPSGPLEPRLREALAAIDAVHRVTDLPTIPVTYGARRFGGYTPLTDDGIRCIVVSPIGPHPRLTLLHEMGHYLDDRMGNFTVYSSTQPDSILSDVLRVIERSHAVKLMRAYLAEAADMPIAINYQLRHWLEPVEGWARAYVQYIVSRSENIELRNDLTVQWSLGASRYIAMSNGQTMISYPSQSRSMRYFKYWGGDDD